VIVTKITIAVALLVYVGLWILAINGARGLLPILIVPLVLVVLIGAGSALTRYMGIPTHSPKFNDHDQDDEA
jgi:hypothetical protein